MPYLILVLAIGLLSGCGSYSGGEDGAATGASSSSGASGGSTGSGSAGGSSGTTGSGSGGTTPPPDSGVDLLKGSQDYARICASCHGASGKGGVGPALTSTTSCPSCASHPLLSDRIADTMPSTKPGSCTGSCADNIAAYILNNFSSATSGGGSGTSGGTTSGGTTSGGTTSGGTGSGGTTSGGTTSGGTTSGGTTSGGTTSGGSGTSGSGGSSGTPPPAPTCSVSFSYQSVWNTGFTAQVTLRNFSGKAVNGWRVSWTFPNDQQITNYWNTELAQAGPAMDARPKDYNRSIANGNSIDFGMQGNHGGLADLPSDVRLEAEGCITESSGGGSSSSSSSSSGGSGSGGGSGGTTPPVADCQLDELAPRLLRLLTRREYQRSLEDLLGIAGDFAQFLPVEAKVYGYDNNARAGVVTDRHADEYLAAAEAAAARAITENRGALLGCSPSADCTQQFVSRFGRRAFRRPLTTAERDFYKGLMRDELTAGDYDTGLKLIVAALLSSPNFLYRSEAGVAMSGGGYGLDGYEIASGIAYTLLGAPPDDALLDAAATGQLGSGSGRRAQAERLLGDGRAREEWSHFAEQWLGVELLRDAFRDPEVFPRWNDAVRLAMVEEFDRFFAHVAFDSSGARPWDELFTANYVFANRTLAEFYRLPGAAAMGEGFQQVAVGDGTRGGLLTLGMLLGAHAHSNESSPVKRGVAVRERLLCQDLPDPPADVDTTPPGLDPSLTTRERFARHTDDPKCSACHSYIDPVGFGFERYDGVGDYRAVENDKSVDDSGSVKDREALGAGTSEPFTGPRQLGSLIAATRSAQDCLALQYYRHSYGLTEAEGGACAIRAMSQRFQSDQLSFRALIAEQLAHDSFTRRK
ncbi:MAG: DUF1592 domain-containing protein [Stagnimonas sp.]|nr:DUF1592 domain-containing protein [Stagnimonas sp.]